MVKDVIDGYNIRSLDRGNLCGLPYFHHHAAHDAKSYCRPGYRGYGSAFAGRVLRAVRARLAVSLGIQIHWVVMVMSLIVLLAVGSDYNLLLVSRMKEEIGAGINTGIIRAMGGTGKVVTCCGPGVRFHHGVHGRQRPAQSSVRSVPPSASVCCSTRWSCVRS